MKILVTGATGFIGSHMVDHALQLGYDTWAAIRATSSLCNLHASSLQYITLDFSDTVILEDQLKTHRDRYGNWDVIIHCAGVTKCHDKHEFERVNYEGTCALVNTLLRLDMIPDQFIFLSSLGIYGPLHEQEPYRPFSETDTPHPNTLYGKSKYKTESYIKSVEALPYVIFKPTGVYGPRDKDFQILVRGIRNHIALSLGRRPQQITFVYIKDLIHAVFLAIKKRVKRRSYLITDGNTYSSDDFTHAVQTVLGNPFTLRITFPLWLGRFAASLSDMTGHLLRRSFTFNSDKFQILAQRNWKCDISPLTDELGYIPQYSLEEGIRETIACPHRR